MVTKTEELYSSLLSMKVVSFDEIVEKAGSIVEAVPSRRYIYRKYVHRLVKKKEASEGSKRIVHCPVTYRKTGNTRRGQVSDRL